MQLNQVPSWFQQQRAWSGLTASSQEVYTVLLRQGLEGLGLDRDVHDIKARDADSLYSYLWDSTSPHKANSVCVVLRRVWNVLIRYEEADINPFAKMDLSSTPHRTVRWYPEQVDEFIAASISYGLPSIGLLLYMCYMLGQRVGDMRLLMWDDYYDHGVHFRQQKTKKEMHVFVPVELQDDLELVSRLGPYIVTREDTHQPYTKDDYQPIYRAVRKLALLPSTLQLRDARRSALWEIEENEGTDGEIQSVGGHDRRSTLNVYTGGSLKTSQNAQNKRFKG